MEDFDFSPMKLNTIKLERGENPNGNIKDYCNYTINGKTLDKNQKDFFSIQSKRLVFGENYKDYNQIKIIDIDGSEKIINIPTIINGGMGTNVSSPSLVKAMNELGFGGHLSSVCMGPYHYNERFPNRFSFSENGDEDKTPQEKKDLNDELKEIVEKDFDEIFKDKLGLSDKLINKHFFVCDDLGKDEKNTGFNGEYGKEKLARKMDLVALYNEVTKLKKDGNNVGINCMYKTSSYTASLKISVLLGIDYITTAAGNPEENPKQFLTGFFDDLKSKNIKFSLPAFGLLVSSGNPRMFKDFDYDYYIFEEGDKAGGHIITMGTKFKELEKIKKLFEKKGKIMPPIYDAGAADSQEDIKEVFDNGFDGIQIGTIPAASEESCGGLGFKFKRRLIGGNHLGPDTEIDEEFFSEVDEALKGFEAIVEKYNKLILSKISEDNGAEYTEETPEIAKVRDYIYKSIYSDFFQEKIDELDEKELEIYNQIKTFIFENYKGDIDEINKVLRDYGNAKKFIKEFNTFIDENKSKPTHLVFDSTVGFPGRMKIIDNVYEIVAGNIKSSGCVNCLTSCILAGRGNVRDHKGSKFCILDRLNYLKEERNMVFSGKSTVPYPEVRPLKDLMAYLMGTYVNR